MRLFALRFLALSLFAFASTASAQDYPRGQYVFPVQSERLAELASEFTLDVYLGQSRERLFVYHQADGTAYLYKGPINDAGPADGIWQKGRWQTNDRLYCLQTTTIACGIVWIEKRPNRKGQIFWHLSGGDRLEITDRRGGDPETLTNPRRFYQAETEHDLKDQTVLIRAQSTPLKTAALRVGDQIISAEVLGYRQRIAGTVPAGLLLRIERGHKLDMRTYSQTERELRVVPERGCLGGRCPGELHFVQTNEILTPDHLANIFGIMDATTPPAVAWRAAQAQLGWSEVRGAITIGQSASRIAAYNNAQTSEADLTAAADSVAAEQTRADTALITRLLVGQSVRLSPNVMPDIYVHLARNGTGYVYRETIQTQPDPRRGTWRQGKWRVENGQLCFPALADDCFAIEQAGPNLHRLVLQDATKSWQPDLVSRVPGDALSLQRAQSFYDWETYHRRIGEPLLFLPLGTRLFNGAAIEQGEIVGYRDGLTDPRQSGFYVQTTAHRHVQVYQTPERELVLGFPQVQRCAHAPCYDEIQFVFLEQVLTEAALSEVLLEAQRWQASGEKWRLFRNVVGGALLGGMAYGLVSGGDDVAKPSHGVTDDLADILADRLRQYDEAFRQRMDAYNSAFEEAQQAQAEAADSGTATDESDADYKPDAATPNSDTLRITFDGADFFSNDPFRVLGVSAGATKDEVKSAWRELVKQWHPDVQVGAEAKEQAETILKRVNWAYEQLRP